MTDPIDMTIAQLLERQATRMPDASYAIFPDRIITFGELHDTAQRVAQGLIALGVKRGDHVATLMPNVPDWVFAHFGILYAGAVTVALNARYKRHELAHTIAHSAAKVVMTTDAIAKHVDFASLIRDVLPGLTSQADPRALVLPEAPGLRSVVLCGDTRRPGLLSYDALLAGGDAVDRDETAARRSAVAITDTAAIIYTSGTTSAPKGCELSHTGIQKSWSVFANVVSLRERETVWMPMPFYHTGGIGPMTAILARGAAFVTQPHFDATGVLDLIDKHRIEHLYPGFPQLSLDVVDAARFTPERVPFVRSILNVGPEAMQHHIQDRLPPGAVLLNLFGMTEGSGIITFTPFDAPLAQRAITSGVAPDHTEIRIVDPDSGATLQTDESGEIQFRGGGALKGYFNDPEATAATILPGGWVRTGDRGRIDEDGYLTYVGRLKDMIRVGGENVAAAEIEAYIQRMPGVKLVQIIAVPDQRLSEVAFAFIERADTEAGAALSEAAVCRFCDGSLASWKVPRGVAFVTDWPMSATKIQKFRLHARVPQHFSAQRARRTDATLPHE